MVPPISNQLILLAKHTAKAEEKQEKKDAFFNYYERLIQNQYRKV